ncbi:MAG: PQQ-like beta-propeller repeat protein [Verrucomicrobia bacterium]|nr:PQQ-like beta-propeller repeat protein [Verrucomicrobiota bacterium]
MNNSFPGNKRTTALLSPYYGVAMPNRFGALIAVLIFTAANSQAMDWPQYRGPNHDGTSADPIRSNWSQEPPREIWRVPLGPGLSSFSVSGGRAFTLASRRAGEAEQEFCVALDAATGRELWATPLDVADYPNGGVGADDGPRSTPSVDGDRVYVLTSYLRLACLEAATGRMVWDKNLVQEFGSFVIPWQNAASPLVEGDLVLVNGNGRQNEHLLAFRKPDGTLAWKGQSDGMTQATPAAATINGVRQVVFFAQSGLVAVAPETGSVLWRHALRYNGTSVAASPVVAGDRVYASRAYPSSFSAARAGAVTVRVTPSGSSFSATPAWSKVNQLMNHWATPVHYNGHLYGMFGQDNLQLKCVELATGNEKWSVGGFGYGSVLVADGKILATSANGWLVLVDPNPNAYTELGRYRALDGKTWNVPAVSNGRIYFRSTTEAACIDVAGQAPLISRLKLKPALSGQNGVFRMSIANEDGSPLDAGQVAKIDVLATESLGTSAKSWSKLAISPILENGQLRFEAPMEPAQPRRFFKVQERP